MYVLGVTNSLKNKIFKYYNHIMNKQLHLSNNAHLAPVTSGLLININDHARPRPSAVYKTPCWPRPLYKYCSGTALLSIAPLSVRAVSQKLRFTERNNTEIRGAECKYDLFIIFKKRQADCLCVRNIRVEFIDGVWSGRRGGGGSCPGARDLLLRSRWESLTGIVS